MNKKLLPLILALSLVFIFVMSVSGVRSQTTVTFNESNTAAFYNTWTISETDLTHGYGGHGDYSFNTQEVGNGQRTPYGSYYLSTSNTNLVYSGANYPVIYWYNLTINVCFTSNTMFTGFFGLMNSSTNGLTGFGFDSNTNMGIYWHFNKANGLRLISNNGSTTTLYTTTYAGDWSGPQVTLCLKLNETALNTFTITAYLNNSQVWTGDETINFYNYIIPYFVDYHYSGSYTSGYPGVYFAPHGLNFTYADTVVNYDLTVNAPTHGGFNVTSGSYGAGTVVGILATPDAHYHLTAIDIDGSNSTTNPFDLTMDQAHTITAYFDIDQFYLTIGADTEGNMNDTSKFFPYGQEVYILDTPSANYHFASFTLDATPSYVNPIMITMTQNHTLTADNDINQFYFNVTAPSNGNLNVSSGWYSYGDQFYIMATPAINYEFAAIDIDGSNETASHITSVTMDENHTCTAYFDLIWDYLTLTIPSNGGLNRSSAYWPNGTEVYVLATPDPLYHFVAYSLDGGANTTANPIMIIMDTDHTLTTYFEINGYNLTVAAPIGGFLNQTSEDNILADVNITVLATPDILHTFANFTLDGSDTTDNPLTFTMDQNHTLSVNFDLIPLYKLTINTPSGGSINDTTAIYLSGSLVYLSETPGTNKHFLTWVVDGVNDTNPQISIYMDGNHTVTALFAPNSTPALHVGDSPNTPGSELVILFVLILALVIWQRQKLKVPHIKT